MDKTKILITNGSLMKVQYFWPALSDNRSWKPIFRLLRVTVLHRFYFTSKVIHLTITMHMQLSSWARDIISAKPSSTSHFVFASSWALA